MNLKQSIEGVVERIGAVEEKGQHKFKEVIVRHQQVDEFGDASGKPDVFRMVAWNGVMQKLPELQKGDHVKVLATLSGHEGIDKNSKIFHSLNLSIQALKKI